MISVCFRLPQSPLVSYSYTLLLKVCTHRTLFVGSWGRTHFTGALWATLPHVTKAQMQPGDLIFPTPSHVGIYLGNNQFVVAPHTGSYVQVENVGTIWGIARVTGDAGTAINVNPVGSGGSGTSLVGLPRAV